MSTEKERDKKWMRLKNKRIQAEKDRRFAWTEEQASQGGLKIVVLKHMFNPEEIKDNDRLCQEIEIDVQTEIERTWGTVLKLELFREHPDGVIKLKFDNPLSAERWVEEMNGRAFDGRKVIAEYWDGKTNYKRINESADDLDSRVNEFGDWLNQQDLPEELKQKKEAEGATITTETNEAQEKQSEEIANDNSTAEPTPADS